MYPTSSKTIPEFSVSIYDMEEEELMLDLRENRIDIALPLFTK